MAPLPNLVGPYLSASGWLLGFDLTPTTLRLPISSPMGTIPGGPSPDSALPPHSNPIPVDTRHQAAASVIDTETHRRHHQEMASQHRQQGLSASGTDLLARNPFSDEHAAIAPDVRVAALNTEAAAGVSPSLGREAKRSISVASRRTDRGLPANNMGEGVSVEGAVTAANGPPDMDPNPQGRAANFEEHRQKASIGREGHGVGRKVSKIEKRGAKVDKTTLHIALQELAEVQELNAASVEKESGYHTTHSRAMSDAHKAEMDLLAARVANDHAQVSLQASKEALETTRRHVRETDHVLQAKTTEVDRLRARKTVNDKEQRATKSSVRRGLSKILRSG